MRLACLSHAASVQAEPGSNSSIKFLGPPPLLTPRVTRRLLSGLAGADSFRGRVVLETSLSRPAGPRPVRRAVTAPAPATAGGQPAPRTGGAGSCKAQTSIWLTYKLIKEDHFCVSTTRMPEARLRRDVRSSPDRRRPGIAPETPPTGPPHPRRTPAMDEAHTLMAVRLFTCQRAL